MKRVLAMLAVCVLGSAFAVGQSAPVSKSPVTDAVRQLLERQSKNLVAAAEEMPAEKYDYKPTPEQRSFAQIISHTAESNNFLCSSISGRGPRAQFKPAVFPDAKTTAVDGLRSSFDFCKEALAQVDDSKLGEQVNFFGSRKVTRAMALFAIAADWADHYSALATYLRLNKLMPPTAQRSGGAGIKPTTPESK